MSTYVQITREELELWIKTLPLKGPVKMKPGTTGVYWLPIAPDVAVALSSTIGSKDDAMGRGDASMKLALVSTATKRTLNRKAQGQGHFKRTINWKKTWRDGFDRMQEAYTKSAGFYDALALIEDQDRYISDLKKRIESRADWQNEPILCDFHQKLTGGGILTLKQVQLLETLVARAQKPAPKPSTKIDNVPNFLEGLRELWRAARAKNDRALLTFIEASAATIKKGGDLPPQDISRLRSAYHQYDLGGL
jgi:hypothetical protein